MEFITMLISFVVHIDKHLDTLIDLFGAMTYVILFIVVFCETGLVITPFLPGDSLLFAIGAFAARGSLHFSICYVTLLTAAIIGDTVNYHIGKSFGQMIYEKEKIHLIKKENIDRTIRFFEKHGGKTIFIARFMPIIRTFAPFVAGMGKMHYGRFLLYNATGAVTWVSLFMVLGYFFGNLDFVQNNFMFIMVAIVGISMLPILITGMISRYKSRADKKQ